jgi:large subunit ribosomal protein L4
MVTVAVKNLAGSDCGSVDLDDEMFGIEANVPLMHQVVNAQLAARRAGTHSTKTRKEVRGGGAKPWKQKGTGRARAGSTRSPIWIGGGIAHGPKPRDYSERTNKKMIKQALRCALSDRAADEKVVVVEAWDFDAPSTKQAKAALGALGVEGRALVVVGREDFNAVRSFRNLPQVHVLAADQLNAYDVLVSDYVLFAKDNLPSTAPAPAAAVAEESA